MRQVLRRPNNSEIMVLGVLLKGFEVAKNAHRSSGGENIAACS